MSLDQFRHARYESSFSNCERTCRTCTAFGDFSMTAGYCRKCMKKLNATSEALRTDQKSPRMPQSIVNQ